MSDPRSYARQGSPRSEIDSRFAFRVDSKPFTPTPGLLVPPPLAYRNHSWTNGVDNPAEVLPNMERRSFPLLPRQELAAAPHLHLHFQRSSGNSTESLRSMSPSITSSRRRRGISLAQSIARFLEQEEVGGAVLLSQLPARYKRATEQIADFRSLGYRKFIDLLQDFPELFRIVGDPKGGHQMVFSSTYQGTRRIPDEVVLSIAFLLGQAPMGVPVSDLVRRISLFLEKPFRCEECGYNTMMELLVDIPHVARIEAGTTDMIAFAVNALSLDTLSPSCSFDSIDGCSSRGSITSPVGLGPPGPANFQFSLFRRRSSSSLVTTETLPHPLSQSISVAVEPSNIWSDFNQQQWQSPDALLRRIQDLGRQSQTLLLEHAEVTRKEIELRTTGRYVYLAAILAEKRLILENKLRILNEQRDRLEFQRPPSVEVQRLPIIQFPSHHASAEIDDLLWTSDFEPSPFKSSVFGFDSFRDTAMPPSSRSVDQVSLNTSFSTVSSKPRDSPTQTFGGRFGGVQPPIGTNMQMFM